jgi:hypothetical protein
LAGRRAIKAHYVVDEFADQPMVTDLEFAPKAVESSAVCNCFTFADCTKARFVGCISM